jgi:hypothetical protein
VLVGSPVLDPPTFPDGQAKLDYMSGALSPPARFPTGPDTSGGYPVISADAALALLRSQFQMSSSGTPAATQLRITDVRIGTGMFLTDRGDKALPAWLFSMAGVDGPASVLAISPEAQWSPRQAIGSRGSFVNGVMIGSDQRTVTAGFTGAAAGNGPDTASYTLTLTESTTAVVVALTEQLHKSSTTACDLIGYQRSATAVLSRPLGARVVIDAVSGKAVAVR